MEDINMQTQPIYKKGANIKLKPKNRHLGENLNKFWTAGED